MGNLYKTENLTVFKLQLFSFEWQVKMVTSGD